MSGAKLAEQGTLTEELMRDHVRSVTDDEVDFYDEHGWVKLPELLSAELVELILTHVQRAAGYVEGEGFTKAFTDLDKPGETRTAWYSTNLHHHDDFLKVLSRSRALAEAHGRLMKEKSLRLWSDSTNTKPPGGERTPWHQDMQAFPFDRPAGGGLWVALVEMVPDMAPLQHLSGSHHEPWTEPTAKDPDSIFTPGSRLSTEELLEKYPISPAQHLQPGDTLAHGALTFHGTEYDNVTNRIRWAWISQRFPADVKYIDKRNVRSDGLGLVPGRPLDHPVFPVVV
jgi:ectoine hydroxylase-related dioxygenase (phytanoyl-CoA dioxygenase family)